MTVTEVGIGKRESKEQQNMCRELKREKKLRQRGEQPHKEREDQIEHGGKSKEDG